MAIKMFGTTNALNKVITIDKDQFTVTGVLKDLPPNTRFAFEFILPWEYLKKSDDVDDNWGNNSVNSFVLLKKGVDVAALEKKIVDITIRHSGHQEDSEVFLHPSSKWHLYSSFENGKVSGGRIEIVRLFGIIAGFILLIACINFMNLSTARSEKRAKEVGIRKTAGANKGILIGQFIGESVLISFLAGLIALVLVILFLPSFSLVVGKTLEVPYDNPYFWLLAATFIVMTGIIAGSYPAFFLSSFQPITILKGTFRKANAAVNPRKVLVVVQFTFAIILITATMIVVQQIRYAQARDAGYNREQVVYHWITGDLYKNYNVLKDELLQSGIATSVTKTSSPLGMPISDTWGWSGRARVPITRQISIVSMRMRVW